MEDDNGRRPDSQKPAATMILIRFILLLGALAIAALLIVTHGVRGVLLLVAIALVTAVPRTRGWKWGERVLVRVTGSRRRAAVIAMLIVIGTVAVVAVVQYVR